VHHGLIVALLRQNPRGGWIAGAQGAKRHGFSFHGDASHAPCRHPFDRVLGERCARRGGEFAASQQQPAATPSPSPSGQKGGAGRGTRRDAAAAAEQHRLPPDSTTRQTLALPGRTLDFTATAGSIRLFDDKGEPQADIAHTSYQLESVNRASRPVTFLFNGGPGASSAWLQFGDAGPWRVSIRRGRLVVRDA
jgi:Carboxypeptidase C (cathepsin A)